MRTLCLKVLTLLFIATLVAQADDKLPLLKVNGQTYTNVTVTVVTPTDIYFTFANGMGNAKLKALDPELQRRFHYDAANSSKLENERVQANAEYRQKVLSTPPPPKPVEETAAQPASPATGGDDFVAPKLYARSVRGQAAPPLVVEKWLTAPPDTAGKFILIDFWATWCGPCRRSIPEINGFFARFHDRMAVIGISDEAEAAVRKMTSPQIDYAVGIDPGARMMRTLEITGIPHCILIDPKGIVRYEGMPNYLDDQKLGRLLEKYAR